MYLVSIIITVFLVSWFTLLMTEATLLMLAEEEEPDELENSRDK